MHYLILQIHGLIVHFLFDPLELERNHHKWSEGGVAQVHFIVILWLNRTQSSAHLANANKDQQHFYMFKCKVVIMKAFLYLHRRTVKTQITF